MILIVSPLAGHVPVIKNMATRSAGYLPLLIVIWSFPNPNDAFCPTSRSGYFVDQNVPSSGSYVTVLSVSSSFVLIVTSPPSLLL